MNKSIKTSRALRLFVPAGIGAAFAFAPFFLTGCGGKQDATMTAAPVTQGNAPPPVANRDLSHRLGPLVGPRAKGGKVSD